MTQRLKDQVAIVTGSNSGIGEGIARAFALEGAQVVINYPVDGARDKAISVCEEIVKSGGKAIAIKADVSVEADVQALFAETVKTFGTVDILVNNAGIQMDSAFTEMTLEQWNRVI